MTEEGIMITKALLMSLLMWISSHTSYDVSRADIPRVEFRTKEEIQDIYYGDCKKDTRSSILAVHTDGVVYLNDTVNIKKKKDRALIVHELTHYLQFVHSNQIPKTHEEREVEAIAVENMWRKSNGLRKINRPVLVEPSCN